MSFMHWVSSVFGSSVCLSHLCFWSRSLACSIWAFKFGSGSLEAILHWSMSAVANWKHSLHMKNSDLCKYLWWPIQQLFCACLGAFQGDARQAGEFDRLNGLLVPILQAPSSWKGDMQCLSHGLHLDLSLEFCSKQSLEWRDLMLIILWTSKRQWSQ